MPTVLFAVALLISLLGFLNLVAEHTSWKSLTLDDPGHDARIVIAQVDAAPVIPSGTPELPRVSKYHTVVTSDDSVYSQWQSRVHYYHWKKLKAKEGTSSPVGGYTRLLHSGIADGLTAEIPTVVVDSLPREVPDEGYIVLHRPYGLLQWVLLGYTAELEEDYIFMSEPDHLFLRLPRLLASRHVAASYHFTYMNPLTNRHIIQRYNTRNVNINDVYPVGNSPTMIAKDKFEQICPLWYNLTVKFKRDQEVDRGFGWILEMYAWSVASSQLPTGSVKYRLHQELMVQPPWDAALEVGGKPANILHYTYGQDCRETDGMPLKGQVGTWHFDKRDYDETYPPRHIRLPTRCRARSMAKIVEMINEATAAIEPWQIKNGSDVQQKTKQGPEH